MRFILIPLFLVCFSASAKTTQVAKPIPSGSIGHAYNGCLNSDTHLTGEETGLLKIFVERDRAYGNPYMLQTLGDLGYEYRKQYQWPNEAIQLGDMAQQWGGPVGRHDSHQTGLDADIVYFRNDHRETDPKRGRDVSFDEIFVEKGKVTPNFDGERNWWRFAWLIKNANVSHLFVDAAIKEYFCRNAKVFEPRDEELRTELLRRLRPLALHDDHFHMRLKCPAGDSRCLNNPKDVPAGDGCALLKINGHEFEENAGHVQEQLLEAETLTQEQVPTSKEEPALKPKPIPSDWPSDCRKLRKVRIKAAKAAQLSQRS